MIIEGKSCASVLKCKLKKSDERLRHGLKRVCQLVVVCLTACGFGTASAAPVPQYRLAVVELRNEAELRPSEIAYLTDLARTQARQSLESERFLVMTRESIVALLPPGKTLADCAKVQCEVEVGRTIGADYIVTGEVLRFGEGLRLNLKVHACQSGDFLGSESTKGAKVDDLEAGITESSRRLFTVVRTHASVGGIGSRSVPDARSEGRLGDAAPAWKPEVEKQGLVRFTSEPSGAVVFVDGQLLCQSTPCSKLLRSGSVQVKMQRERYAPRTEVVAVQVGAVNTSVDWKLEPTFGWLTISSEPSGMLVSINEGAAEATPIVKRELEPGAYEIRTVDRNYYPAGERVVLVTGMERQVVLAPTPREGAIDVRALDPQGNDVAASVTVDGRFLGGVPGTYNVMVGTHRMDVTGDAGVWHGDIEVVEREVVRVDAKLEEELTMPVEGYRVLANGQVVRRGDKEWTIHDNGADVDWREALEFCAACRLGGHSDWRVPTNEELGELYDAARRSQSSHRGYGLGVMAPFVLSAAMQWSRLQPQFDEAMGMDFRSGGRYSWPIAKRKDVRTMCVRDVARVLSVTRSQALRGEESEYLLSPEGDVVTRGDLMWTVRDNGSDVNWAEAKAYSRTCRAGGYSDWRLPTVIELTGLRANRLDLPVNAEGARVIARPFQISGIALWSGSMNFTSSAWSVEFHDGERTLAPLEERKGRRVLCVRRAEAKSR